MSDVPPKKPTGLDKTFAFLAPPQKPDEIGRLGEYRVLKLLGKGGMGMVFKAEDPQLQRAIALKIMLPRIAANELARDRFLREARAAAKLEHDHVIAIYQVGQDRGVPFIAMPLLKGMSLEDWLKRNRPLKMAQILRIGREIARGLQAAHERGLIHRDIKPANLWLDAATNGRIKILDFGLARPEKEDAGLTKSGQIVGTPNYMSPEQAEGKKVDPRSDLFSLGVVLYRLCTGVLPFRGPNIMAVLMSLATHDPPAARTLNAETPPAFSDLIDRLMRKNPDERPASAKEVVEAIAAIERQRAELARTGVIAAPRTIAVDSLRAAASQTFNFEESSDSYLSDEEFDAARHGKEARAESGRPAWLWPAIYGAAAVCVLALVGVVSLIAMQRPTAPPLQQVRAKPAVEPPVVTDRPKKVDPAFTAKRNENPTPPQPGAERHLFNGKDLAGWSCDPKVWHVENGEIVAGLGSSQPGTDSDLIPLGKFADFELTFEVRSSRKTANQNCQLIPRFVDYNLPALLVGIEDPGWIFDGRPAGFKVAQQPSPAMTRAMRKNDYNEMTLRVVGNTLTLTVNGIAGDPIEYPMAAEGRIRWHYSARSDSLRIRNIRLVDLSAPAAPPPAASQSRPLFNGKDLSGWKFDPGVWHVDNGMIVAAHGKAAGKSELTAPGRFGDFELTFEARGLRPAGGKASYLDLRAEDPGTRFLYVGLDNPGWIYSGTKDKSLDTYSQPKADMLKVLRATRFNDYVVRVVGKQLTLTVNGVAAAPVEFAMPAEGQLKWIFGEDSTELQLRNIRVAELGASPAASLPQPRPLFNGKDLAGWRYEQSRWHVQNSEIVGTETNHPGIHELIAPGRFGDFELTFEAKTTFSDYDSSNLFLRFEPPDDSVEKQKPPTLAIGMQSLGNVFTIEGDWKFKQIQRASMAMKNARKKNDYNDFAVRFVDGRLTVRVNGVAADPVKAPIPGDVRLSWHLGEKETPDLHVRNIKITELRPPFFGEWEPLKTGRTLDKWWVERREPGGVSTAEQGPAMIRFRTEKPPEKTPYNDISTKKKYVSHHLRLEFQLLAGTRPPRFGVGLSSDSKFSFNLTFASNEAPLVRGYSTHHLEGAIQSGAIVRKTDGQSGTFRFLGEAPIKIGEWNRLQVVRLEDGIVYVLNDRIVGAIAELRQTTGPHPTAVGATMVNLVDSSGDVNVRNVQIREITAMPPEILKLAP